MGRVKRAKKIQVKASKKRTSWLHLTLEDRLRNLAEVLVERIVEEQQGQKGLGNV